VSGLLLQPPRHSLRPSCFSPLIPQTRLQFKNC